jgi:hypothetical protein
MTGKVLQIYFLSTKMIDVPPCSKEDDNWAIINGHFTITVKLLQIFTIYANYIGPTMS